MKKLIALVLALVCFLTLVGCNNRSINYIISNEPNITGVVKETNENAILIENKNGEYWVSLNVENKDSMTHLSIGDAVVVYYDGNIAESYPMQINTVYAILLQEPANGTSKLSSLDGIEIRAVLSNMGITIPDGVSDEDLKDLVLDIEADTDMVLVVSWSVGADFFEEVREAVKEYNGITE